MHFIFVAKLGLFDDIIVKNYFKSRTVAEKFGTGFIHNFRQNFYCCFSQIKDVSILNNLK